MTTAAPATSRPSTRVNPPGARHRASSARLTLSVAEGVHRLQHAYVNCYLIEQGDGLTIVDAAHPRTWPFLVRAIDEIGHSTSDVEAIILTHAHFDHLGFAARAQQEWGVPVMAHQADHFIAEHPYRYAHERPRSLYPIMHPRGIPPLFAMAAAGALSVQGITDVVPIVGGETLDVPGRPEVVFSPGHTEGHCAFLLRDSSALLVGDALVTFNPYTGGYGPQIVSGAATADSALSLDSLEVLAETNARIVLPGHGDSYRQGIAPAVAVARKAGPS